MRVLAAILLLPSLLALGGAALADDDRPRRTVDRPVDVPRPRATGRELVLLLGGYGSEVNDTTWDPLIARFMSDTHYEVRRFGALDEHPFDTVGALDANARDLIAEIRALSPSYTAVHLVTHSMGGAVADRAFELGLGAGDGVRTYVSLAAPHTGSTVARVVERTLTVAGDARSDVIDVLSPFEEVDTAALHDLARAHPPASVSAGVTRLDLRIATDALVLHADARGPPGVDSRILLPSGLDALEGHGALLRDDRALALTQATIARGAAPPDDRGAVLKAAANVVSTGWSDLVMIALALTAAVVLTVARAKRRLRAW